MSEQPPANPPAHRRHRDASLLGFLLSDAHGFAVVGADGEPVGVLDSLRYERYADYPEEIVVRRGRLFWKRHTRIPFHMVDSVERRTKTVRLSRD
jgi:hypothetical protein